MEVWLQYRAFVRSAPRSEKGKEAETGEPLPLPEEADTTAAQSQDEQGEESITRSPTPATTLADRSSTSPVEYEYVGFGEGDPLNPHNWSMAYKAWVIAQLTFLTLSLTFGSSVSSAAASGARLEFGGSELAGTATTGAFVVGIGLGAMPFAPLSERTSPALPHFTYRTWLTPMTVYGRLPVYAVTIVLATLFEVGAGLAPSMPALIILRFFAGVFAATPLSNGQSSCSASASVDRPVRA